MKLIVIGSATAASSIGVVALAWSLPYWKLQIIGVCLFVAMRGSAWLQKATQAGGTSDE